jgi:ParB-like chromosome segregation protein Spo0J
MKQYKPVRATSHVARRNGYALSRDLTPQLVPIAGCKPLGRETRKHPPQQLRKLAASLNRFDFVLPILVDREGRVVAGWGLVLAARQLGLSDVPAVSLTDLSEADLRMLRLALNRITDDAAWDREALRLEFSDLLELEPQIDLEVSGLRSVRSTFILAAAVSIRKTIYQRSRMRPPR